MQLRDYQQHAVDAAIAHFKQSNQSAVMVLPTGAGKSLVLAELAKVANGRVLILTHVKELVAQNAEKVAVLSQPGSIFAAGLKQKDSSGKTVIASVQSAARNLQQFNQPFSLLIIDECHRVSLADGSQYQLLFSHLRQQNPQLKILGLTATPYRLGTGWIYQRHYHGRIGSMEHASFDRCIFELPLRPLIKKGYLAQPLLLDGLAAQYDFSSLQPANGLDYSEQHIDSLLGKMGRATKLIVGQLCQLAASKQGVIIFAATVRHAEEVLSLLKQHSSGVGQSAALITATTAHQQRDQLISAFKAKDITFLVNVAVLTTGFDAPHVDLIAILRPTASVSLFQQMVGRGLRSAPNKSHCLIIDYAANGFDLYYPEVGSPKPTSKAVPVQVPCPKCQFANIFWGLVDNDGDIIEHYGRRCQGLLNDSNTAPAQQCSYRFRARICPDCGSENDIAARICQHCQSQLIDPDKRLKEVLNKQHHHLFRCQQMQLTENNGALTVQYQDSDGNPFFRHFTLDTPAQRRALYALFVLPHSRTPGLKPKNYQRASELVADQQCFRMPQLILLKKTSKGWQHLESIFDYSGRYQNSTHFKDAAD
ncbi:carboxylate--amine ligase [Arsukibacterium sp. MJ3]|uniref:DEAD/DEAH box helicase n=1 Tax=Arsukibacterium sp. MJ3 TaxID=1632859 RepID=UPI00062700D0|nr:DEAD/DEAH box helicase [Arsukibacterium sp. MJ3]KKO47603.1 carboxylate--amine ligase [Arsukibacterium sp. MJ3]